MRRGLSAVGGVAGAALALLTSEPLCGMTMAEVMAPLEAAQGECRPIEGDYSVSQQTVLLYGDEAGAAEFLRIRPAASDRRSFECRGDKVTVYLYEYPDAESARNALSAIQTLVWGERRPTRLHPEEIFRVESVVVVVSGKQPSRAAELLQRSARNSAETNRKAGREFEKAKSAYLKHDYATAEKHFRAAAALAPDHLFVRTYLGHSLFYQEKYAAAIPEYERAFETNARTREADPTEERILTDQLGMAYGLAGQLDKARDFIEAAIGRDPTYPMYPCILACTYAELGEVDQAVKYLRQAFDRRANLISGTFPDPREDDSFKPLLGDETFKRALREMGYAP